MRRCMRRCLVRLPVPGPLAQLVEQGTLNPKVVGSIPTRPIPGLPASSAHSPATRPKTARLGQMRRFRRLLVRASDERECSPGGHTGATSENAVSTPRRRGVLRRSAGLAAALMSDPSPRPGRAADQPSPATARRGRPRRHVRSSERRAVAGSVVFRARAYSAATPSRRRSTQPTGLLSQPARRRRRARMGAASIGIFRPAPRRRTCSAAKLIASPNVPAGTAVVANFRQAVQVYERGDARCRMGHDQRRVRQEPRLGSL